MSADSTVTYTSVHSEARSWSIPSEDPYEEAARQLLEQAPRSLEYVPDPIELEDHIPVYIPEPEHPEDLVPAEGSSHGSDEATHHHPPPPYHSLLPSGTPPLLPIPLPAPSTSCSADIPEADTPPRKRLLLTTPRPSCEVRESSVAAAARQPGPTMAHRVDYSLVDTMETRFRDTERRMMTALEMVNMRVSYQVDVRSRESSEFYSRHHDAQKDRAAVRAEIEHVMQPEMGMIAILQERGARMHVEVARDAPYGLLKCQPLNFKGTEGVVGLTQWFEKMESVYSISNCTVACQVKFATCTLQGNALTWWNSHVKTTTPEAAHAMPWRTLKKMMTDKYCPRGEIKKLEFEMLLKSDKVEKYVGGLPDMIHGSVMATKPKTMQDAIEFATELMDKKISTFAERQAENKRKLDNNNQAQQQLPKRQNVVQAYAAGTGERKEYAGTLPLCNKCKFHHNGPCTVKCANCKRVGHLTRDCWSYAATNNQRTLTCYECGNQGHYRSDCPKLKNGNQARGTETRGRAFALVGGETNQDLDDKEDNTNA
ncbi:reverse transcriptase domain-containing protein [Tanacetum coccineum]